MAPEIATGQHYNHRCDVYSFTLLVWEMMSLERPYASIKCAKGLKERIHENQERPRLSKKWTHSFREMLSVGWDHDQFRRPDMSTMGLLLRAELFNIDKGNEPSVDGVQRRSFTSRNKQKSVIRMPSGDDLSKILKDISSEYDDGIDKSQRR